MRREGSPRGGGGYRRREGSPRGGAMKFSLQSSRQSLVSKTRTLQQGDMHVSPIIYTRPTT